MASESLPDRVLLTIDSGSIDEDALRVLNLLTGRTDTEVTGLYIEDEDLYQAAQLPGLSEVSPSGAVSALDHEALSRGIASQVRQAREQFESLARQHGFNFSFKVTRGRLIDTLLASASSSDLVVVSRSLRVAGLRTRRASHFTPLVAQQKNLLFVNEPWSSGSSVVCLFESAADANRAALQTAARISDTEKLQLHVAVPVTVDTSLIEADKVTVIDNWNEETLVNLCESADARLLVLPPTDQLDWRSLLTGLADRLSCSLLRLGA